MIEQRRYARAPLDSPASFSIKGQPGTREGLAKDISVGGMFIETTSPGGFGESVIVHVALPGANGPFALPGVVRWVRDGDAYPGSPCIEGGEPVPESHADWCSGAYVAFLAFLLEEGPNASDFRSNL